MGQLIWFFLVSNIHIGVKEICLSSRSGPLCKENFPNVFALRHAKPDELDLYVGNQNATSICLWCTFFYAPTQVPSTCMVGLGHTATTYKVCFYFEDGKPNILVLAAWLNTYIYFFSFSWRNFFCLLSKLRGCQDFFYKSSSGLGLGLAVLKL